MTKINVSLKDIGKVVTALEELQRDMKKASEDLPKLLAEEGKNYLDRQYAKSPNRNDPNINFSNIKTGIEKTENGYKLYARGRDVLYEEFGTGDEGQKHQHPVKSKYKLDNYNSGGTILNVSEIRDDAILDVLRKNGINSGEFWFYNKNKTGSTNRSTQLTLEQKLNRAKYLINHGDEVYLTQGIPAGKEVWNTRNYLKSNKVVDKIVRKRGKEMYDKFIKAVKG